MFGDFIRGFWISIYCGRVTDAPPPSMRVMTADTLDGTAFPDDNVPRFSGRPWKFLLKLLATWATLGFRNPPLAGVPN